MPKNRNQEDYFIKAAMYDLLSNYYKYSDPNLHIQYYQQHLTYITKAIYSMRSHEVTDGTGTRPAMVRVLHASPGAPAVDIYINGSRVVRDFAFKNVSKYVSLPPGKYQFDIYPAGTMVSTVFSKKITVEPGTFYTIAAAGQENNRRLLSFIDQPGVAMGGTKVRFIHLSPDAPAVDIAAQNGNVLFPNIAYKEASNYIALSPMILDLAVNVAGTNQTVLSLPKVQLNPNETYTIIAVGLVEGEPPLEAIILGG